IVFGFLEVATMEHASNRADVPFFPPLQLWDRAGSLTRGARNDLRVAAVAIAGLAIQEQSMVDKDRIKGSAEQAKGKVKEFAGKVTGDQKTETEGKADQVKGKVQNTAGGIKDALHDE